jgi:hypothetical protein
MRLSAILLISVFLSSCNTARVKERIAGVDSISYYLNKTAEVFLAIDTLAVKEKYKSVMSNIHKLNELELHTTNNLINDYGILKKGFKEFITTNPYTIDELRFCNKQLEDLKTDIRNHKLSEEEFKLFLKHEANAAQSLRVKMSYYQSRLQSQIIKFNKLNPKVISLIDSLSSLK